MTGRPPAEAAMATCDACLRRAFLVARLGPYIELAATSDPGKRAKEILALNDCDLARAVAPNDADRLLDEAERTVPETLRSRFARTATWTVCRHDAAYPAPLRDLGDEAPALLTGRGDRRLLSRLDPRAAATVVGSRRASRYGREVARLLGTELAAAGIAVVSGMAYGIDSVAHEGALAGEGLTVAVLGGGPDAPSPRGKASLYRRILERGLILSELPPGTRPHRWTFPARNRIMAALGGITVVVEAAERSGSLITATMATDLGRDIGAVPGPVTSPLSAGTNSLLDDGARLVRGAADVLEGLLGPGARPTERCGPPIDSGLAAILEFVERGNSTSDAIALAADRSAAEIAVALTRLELLGYLQCGAGRYARTTLRPPNTP